MRSLLRHSLAALLVAPLLAGCETPDWLGENEGPPLPGERVSVLRLEKALEPDPAISDLQVRLPRPWLNPNWSQTGGVANHAMHHLQSGESLGLAWRVNVGAGSGDEVRLLASPVIADGLAFVLDSQTRLHAISLERRRAIWSLNLRERGEEAGAIGGGVAYEAGALYVTTGYGQVFAFEAQSGGLLWKRDLTAPLRAAPAVSGGRVFAVTFDNRLYALAADNGEVLWTHTGIPEDAGLIGGATPAVDGGSVVAAYSSGELTALRVENGRVIWSDQLVRGGRMTALAALGDIRGAPVVDRGIAFAVSHSGRMGAIDLRSGQRLWERDVASDQMPWLAGDFIFVLTTQAELLCLSRQDGRIRWVAPLPRFADPKARKEPIFWSGPVLVSDRLLVVSSDARAAAISPYSGELMGMVGLPDPVLLPPVVAGGTVYVLTDDAELLALQ